MKLSIKKGRLKNDLSFRVLYLLLFDELFGKFVFTVFHFNQVNT